MIATLLRMIQDYVRIFKTCTKHAKFVHIDREQKTRHQIQIVDAPLEKALGNQPKENETSPSSGPKDN